MTETGDLYYHQTKILEGIKDVVYSTANMNQTATAVCENGIYRITVRPPEMIVQSLRDMAPELKVTGAAAEYIAGDIADWKNIIAVKAGNLTGTAVLNAVDGEGNCYHLEYDPRWTENDISVVSPSGGRVSGGTLWYKYCPDGSVYRAGGENGSWEPVHD